MKIIYKNQDDSIVILHPTTEALAAYSINIIAQKDVPAGVPYWIVEDLSIPEDRTFRAAWRIPPTIKPNGIGHNESTFEGVPAWYL